MAEKKTCARKSCGTGKTKEPQKAKAPAKKK